MSLVSLHSDFTGNAVTDKMAPDRLTSDLSVASNVERTGIQKQDWFEKNFNQQKGNEILRVITILTRRFDDKGKERMKKKMRKKSRKEKAKEKK